MLTLCGDSGLPGPFCDGMSRRNFLQIGSLGIGGLMLPQILKAEAEAGGKARCKSVINIVLPGGPSHQDMFDLKPDAPAEYRGEFNPIATNVPGFNICELLPRLATLADKYTVIRSIYGWYNEHESVLSETGWSRESLRSIGGRPAIGSVLSKLWGPAQVTPHGTAPTYVYLDPSVTRPAFLPRSGFLGDLHGPYTPDKDGLANLDLDEAISVDRLDDRVRLLSGLDRFRRRLDSNDMMQAVDSFQERAVGIITSGDVAQALDLKNEDPRLVERYGDAHLPSLGFNTRHFNHSGLPLLTARRLIEVGVRCLSIRFGSWDTHTHNFELLPRQLPPLDQALSALIEDLDERGMLDETIIMMSGEFGRTPRINKNAGRDHWPQAGFFFLAGGGFRHQGAIGSTTRNAEEPLDRPIHLQQVFAMVYRRLGIDPNTVTLVDSNGRPQFLVDERETIHEMV